MMKYLGYKELKCFILFWNEKNATYHITDKGNYAQWLFNPYHAGTYCHNYRARPACTSMKSDQAIDHGLGFIKLSKLFGPFRQFFA